MQYGSAFDQMPEDYGDMYPTQRHTSSRTSRQRGTDVSPERHHHSQSHASNSLPHRGSAGPGGGSAGRIGHGTTEQEKHRSSRMPEVDHGTDEMHSPASSTLSSKSREIRAHHDQMDREARRSYGTPVKKEEKKFLKKVQRELDDQRDEWKDEVLRMTDGAVIKSVPNSAHPEGTNSFVDTSTGVPVFTAFFDVSDFPARCLDVNVDKLTSKVVVTARQRNGTGNLTKSFTQKVQLPRFADHDKVRSLLSKKGILKIEVPLIYYFPHEAKNGRPTKSFVYEVRNRPDGTQLLEILVNTGPDVRARDLHVEVTDANELVITADKHGPDGAIEPKLIKRYTLPDLAILGKITSKLGKDGRLRVLVPLRKH